MEVSDQKNIYAILLHQRRFFGYFLLFIRHYSAIC